MLSPAFIYCHLKITFALLIFYLDDMPIDISGVKVLYCYCIIAKFFYVCLMLYLFIYFIYLDATVSGTLFVSECGNLPLLPLPCLRGKLALHTPPE